MTKKSKHTVDSIKAEFNEIKAKDFGWSDYVIFMHAIRGKDVPSTILTEAFDELVDKGEYLKREKLDILAYLKEETKSKPKQDEVSEVGV